MCKSCEENCKAVKDGTIRHVCNIVVGAGMIVAGMFGLYHHVEYAGWVLAAGIIVVL